MTNLDRIGLPLAQWLLSLCLFAPCSAPAETVPPAIQWVEWSDQTFERAEKEQKLVLLDLGAVWCHWCHVMDEITYRDPEVVRLLGESYIAVRVDQDKRPDLANRYEEYGWPATIVFRWDGSELAKRAGYLPPKPMAAMLQAFIDEPTPGPSVQPETIFTPSSDAALNDEQRKLLRDRFTTAYDQEQGGWGKIHKYLNWDALEYSLLEAAGDAEMRTRAVKTLEEGAGKLIDPVWGGVYQYSTDGDWDHPHFEKIMPFQAENMRVFAIAAILLKDERWIGSAQKIHSYLQQFLTSPVGAFYTSQDADLVQGEQSAGYFKLPDQERRKLGIPRVDTHLYARENGLAITGLCALHAASGDPSALAEATRAANWILNHRTLPQGGFRHDETDAGGPFLADTLAMGRAFLALYSVTAERAWLTRACSAADFIRSNFQGTTGYLSSAAATAKLQPRPQLDENTMLVRFSWLLHQHTGNPDYLAMAEHGMRFLASPAWTEDAGFSPGILLADRTLGILPPHITVVGSKSDPAARQLFAAGLRIVPAGGRLEWWDATEGPMPNAEVTYPQLEKAAAFSCTDGRCSMPIFTPERLVVVSEQGASTD